MNKLLTNLQTIILLVLSIPLFSQEKDSVLITKEYKYVIENGKPTRQSFVYNQLTMDMNKIPIRSIYFDDSTKQISHYNFYWYRNNHLVRQEQYNKHDEIIKMIKWYHDEEGFNIKKEIFLSYPDTSNPDTIYLFQDQQNSLKNKKLVYIKNEKTPIKYIIEYDNNGWPIKERIKGKKTNEYLPKKIEYKHDKDTLGNIILKEEIQTWKDSSISKRFEHVFNDKNQKTKTKFYVNNRLKWWKEFRYYESGKRKYVKIYDSDDKVMSFYTYRYDLQVIPLGKNKNYHIVDEDK